MITLYLIDHGLLSKPSLYWSDFLEQNRGAYYYALTSVRVSNDLAHWVKFFLTAIVETMERLNTLSFMNHASAALVVEQSIHCYNHKRLHSTIEYLTPSQKRMELLNAA